MSLLAVEITERIYDLVKCGIIGSGNSKKVFMILYASIVITGSGNLSWYLFDTLCLLKH